MDGWRKTKPLFLFPERIVSQSDGQRTVLIGVQQIIGYHFPDTAEFTDGMDSKVILKKTIELIATKGYHLVNIDATICAERPKMNPRIPEMKACMAEICGCDVDDISIKATTTEKLGFTGREEGISAYAVCLIEKD